MNDLFAKHCIPCEGDIPPMDRDEIEQQLHEIPGWKFNAQDYFIFRTFHFKNYYLTMAFVNMVAWLAHQENHHPQLEVGYDQCTVKYWTHAIQGLSRNDFICARKINLLIE